MCQNGSLCNFIIPEIDFTENQSDRKIMKFLHCACELVSQKKVKMSAKYCLVKKQWTQFIVLFETMHLPHNSSEF